jgi:hypothetical protein
MKLPHEMFSSNVFDIAKTAPVTPERRQFTITIIVNQRPCRGKGVAPNSNSNSSPQQANWLGLALQHKFHTKADTTQHTHTHTRTHTHTHAHTHAQHTVCHTLPAPHKQNTPSHYFT